MLASLASMVTRFAHPALIFASLGALLVVISSARYGIGVGTDTASYVSAAESFLQGRGYVTFEGALLQRYPPVYPTLIAALWSLVHDPYLGAAWLNIAGIAIVNGAVARWAWAHLESRVVSLFVSSAVLVAPPLLEQYSVALSEAPFILSVTLALCALDAAMRTGRRIDVIHAAVFSSLAVLTRYVGITVVITGCIAIACRAGRTPRQRLQDVAVFLVITTVPIAAWLTRNYLSTGMVAADWPTPAASFAANLWDLLSTFGTWLLPRPFPWIVRVLGLVVAVLALAYLARAAVSTGLPSSTQRTLRSRAYLPFLLFPVVYLAFIFTIASFITLDVFANRFLAVLYIPLAVLVALVLDAYWAGCLSAPTAVRRRTVLSGALRLWLVYPAAYTVLLLGKYLTTGPGFYPGSIWRYSESMQYIREHDVGPGLYTNESYAVYLFTGQVARETPTAKMIRSLDGPTSASRIDLDLRAGQAVTLVWFETRPRDDLVPLSDLLRDRQVQHVAALADGAVYIVRAAP